MTDSSEALLSAKTDENHKPQKPEVSTHTLKHIHTYK